MGTLQNSVKYKDILTPHLLNLYKEAVHRGSFPKEIDQATIVVILKTGPPFTSCTDYRAISLFDGEVKYFF